MRKPVAWGAVLLSYAGIIATVAYAAAVGGANQDAVLREGHRADSAIVKTGQLAIHSGCDFDNQRARELRGILERSYENQQKLVKAGSLDTKTGRENLRDTRVAIKSISLRNCDKEAAILTNER